MNRHSRHARPLVWGAVLAAALAAMASAGGCGRAEMTGPPELRVGRDQCAECGMLIAEDRCAAAALVERHGRREHRLFDDIGCMLDHDAAAPPESITLERFVRDHHERAWIAADQATLVVGHPDRVPTPMGSGIIAFASESQALAKAREVEGSTARYADLLRKHANAAAAALE